MRRGVVCVAAMLMLVQSCRAQDTTLQDVGTTRRWVATGMVGGMLVGSMISSYFDWWKGSARPFHFVREGFENDYALGIDKIGHSFTAYYYFKAFHAVMEWGGFTRSQSLWWAAGTVAFFSLSIEVGDGVSPYGFSYEDLSFNMGGLGYAMLQSEVPVLRNFNLKWSYVPSEGYRWPPHFTNHYDAHTYWLTVNVHNLLPDNLQSYWPEFIHLAVGYSVADNSTKREGVIGIDIDLGSFSVRQPELHLLQDMVSPLHIPSPAIKFTEGKPAKAYLFHLN